MAAEILDDDGPAEDGNLDQALSTPPVAAPAPATDKPRKFAGKTTEQIEEAYAALEKKFGEQGQEVGELRRLSDGLIRSSLEGKSKAAAPSTTEPTSSEEDYTTLFFTDPKTAVTRLLREDATLAELTKHKQETQQERARRITVEKHPDCDDLANDPEFQAWVTKSKIRHNLWGAACQFDADAADELFSTFKQIRPSKAAPTSGDTAAVAEESDKIVEAQKRAAGAASGTTGTEPTSGLPIYSRRKIMELKMRDPEQYEARGDEFLRAYAEDRVRP